jgi:predicted nuclease with RNAse H fold
MPSDFIVVGVDVGGTRKGFHAVCLRGLTYIDQFASIEADAITAWCQEKGAHIVGIDAPCRWSTDDRARPAERELMKGKIWCFSSPTRSTALAHPKDNFRWMLNGELLFAQLTKTHSLFQNTTKPLKDPVCFETFPQAIACALAGEIVSAKTKRTTRRDILARAGIDIRPLTNIDKIDAALCALAAQRLSIGDYQAYGDIPTGHIIVPRRPLQHAPSI